MNKTLELELLNEIVDSLYYFRRDLANDYRIINVEDIKELTIEYSDILSYEYEDITYYYTPYETYAHTKQIRL